MTGICEILVIKVGAKTILEFDASKYLAPGDSIVGVATVVEDSTGLITTVGAATITGTKITTLVSGIAIGKSIVTVSFDTAYGARAIDEQNVTVY